MLMPIDTSLHPLEEAMNKSPLALVAAIIVAVTMLASTAEAGFKIRFGFGGPFNAHGHGGGYSDRHFHRKRYYARRVVKKEKVYVAKKKAEPKVVAKKDKPEKVASKAAVKKPVAVAAIEAVEPEVIADSENSSITTATLDQAVVEPVSTSADETATAPVTPPEAKPVKAASKLDCKKFFPSVGMTLTVPCE